jgi:hypothetical protein
MADIPECPNCGSMAAVVMQFERPLVEWNFNERGKLVGISDVNSANDIAKFYCDCCDLQRLDLQVIENVYGEWELLPADLGESGAIAAWNRRTPVWIPIEERLPTIEETYNDDALFVWNGKMVRACFNPNETMKNGVEPLSFYTQDENGYDYQLDFVTHWMTVEPPADPKESKDV